jgi:hypothetical protein
MNRHYLSELDEDTIDVPPVDWSGFRWLVLGSVLFWVLVIGLALR